MQVFDVVLKLDMSQTCFGVWNISALFPVLSTLYISPIFYIFEKIINNLYIPIPISFLSFVDDGLFISQKKNSLKSNTNLFSSYNIISLIFNQFRLEIKHNKSKIFHFSRATKIITLYLST